MASVAALQAEREAGRVDEDAGTWFSNPGLDHGQVATGTGVGKYLSMPKQAPAKAPANGLDATSEPAPKKQKQAATSYANFDAW